MRSLLAMEYLLQDCLEPFQRGAPGRFAFSTEPDLWVVEGDERELTTALAYLLSIGRQVVRAGGFVELTLKNEEPTDATLLAVAAVCLTARCEVPVDAIPPAGGSAWSSGDAVSLGPIVSVLAAHGGRADVLSMGTRGVEIRIALPAHEAGAEEERTVTTRGRILVMDDRAEVREVTRASLEVLGFEVRVAIDGADAIEELRVALAAGRRFDAVIMDLVIPNGMGGQDAIRYMLELDPALCAIASSGASGDAVLSDPTQFGFRGVLTKPWSLQTLDATLRTCLETSAANGDALGDEPSSLLG